jgi:hypothetical protein
MTFVAATERKDGESESGSLTAVVLRFGRAKLR